MRRKQLGAGAGTATHIGNVVSLSPVTAIGERKHKRMTGCFRCMYIIETRAKFKCVLWGNDTWINNEEVNIDVFVRELGKIERCRSFVLEEWWDSETDTIEQKVA